jgi:hypothetical protein
VETGRVGVAAGVIRAGVVAVATDGETVGVAAWVGGELVVWVGSGVVAVVVDASGTGVGVRAVACTGELAMTPAQMPMATPMACLPLTHVEGHRVVTIAVTPERGFRGGELPPYTAAGTETQDEAHVYTIGQICASSAPTPID